MFIIFIVYKRKFNISFFLDTVWHKTLSNQSIFLDTFTLKHFSPLHHLTAMLTAVVT